jgi:histidinol-phosphate aminotransferase
VTKITDGEGPELCVGVGARRGAPASSVVALVEEVLREAGLPRGGVVELATVAAKAAEPGLVAAAAELGVPLRGHAPELLAGVSVPHPSVRVAAAAGTPSVAEAAALAGGGDLLVAKRVSQDGTVTCAVARRPSLLVSLWSSFGQPMDRTWVREVDSTGTETGPENAGALPGPGPTPHDRDADHAMLDATHQQADAGPQDTGDVCPGDGHDLRHHGDSEVRDEASGLVDLAVNVRADTPPTWLRERIAGSLSGLAAYPDGRRARAAVAARHGLPVERVLLTAGSAEAFVLLARALRVGRPVVVHPQFTEPEAALRDAGHTVRRVLLSPGDGFRLDPSAIPEDADLVVIGNPTNPTSVLHPAETVAAMARPGRTLVVDEAFMDAVPGETESLAGDTGVPGLVVLRSLTKTWGLAGLRIGYVLAEPGTVAVLQRAQPLWPVSSPALAAAEACMAPTALAEAEEAARRMCAERAHLLAGLAEFDEVHAVAAAEAPFVLVRIARADTVRARLRTHGFVARRGDTFPGLGRNWLRLAVRDRATTNRFLQALDLSLTATS